MSGSFHVIDYVVMGVYLIAVVGLGSWFARGQHSLQDYFLAGRTMPFWAVGMSIIATDLSAVSYMGAPAWVYEKDLQYALAAVLLPLTLILVVVVYVPLFYRLQVYTVYEYLGRRFNLPIRLLACACFVFYRVGWLATVIYTPSLAISYTTGIPLISCILAVGVLTTLYTVLGGMKAVIWTDVVQFCVLAGGAVAVAVVLIVRVEGGVIGIWRTAATTGHTKLLTFSFDPMLEVTVWSMLFGLTWAFMNAYGCDQVVVQRYFTVKSLRESVKSVLTGGLLVLPLNIVLYFIGVALVAFYAIHPDLAEGLEGPKGVLPYFIVQGLPIGVSGLLIAGIVAATMSSIDSGIQSLTTTTIIDFIRPFRSSDAPGGEQFELRLAHVIMVAWGTIATILGLFVGRLGTFLEITGKIAGLSGGPLGGMFLLGVLVPRSNSRGAFVGAVAGFLWALGLSTLTAVSWMWWGVSAGAVTIFTGALASLLGPAPGSEVRRYTWLGDREDAGRAARR